MEIHERIKVPPVTSALVARTSNIPNPPPHGLDRDGLPTGPTHDACTGCGVKASEHKSNCPMWRVRPKSLVPTTTAKLFYIDVPVPSLPEIYRGVCVEIIECDCNVADECPQGQIGHQSKCRIVKKKVEIPIIEFGDL